VRALLPVTALAGRRGRSRALTDRGRPEVGGLQELLRAPAEIVQLIDPATGITGDVPTPIGAVLVAVVLAVGAGLAGAVVAALFSTSPSARAPQQSTPAVSPTPRPW
jgi:hypothetical protein